MALTDFHICPRLWLIVKPLKSIHTSQWLVVKSVNIDDHISPQGHKKFLRLKGYSMATDHRSTTLHSIFVHEESCVLRTKVYTKKGREQKTNGKEAQPLQLYKEFFNHNSVMASSACFQPLGLKDNHPIL